MSAETLEADKYEGWSILELMGHRRLPGYVKVVQLGGTPMFQIDIPTDPKPVTQFYSGASIYCLTPTTEDIARALAKKIYDAGPVSRYEIEHLLPPVDTDDDNGRS